MLRWLLDSLRFLRFVLPLYIWETSTRRYTSFMTVLLTASKISILLNLNCCWLFAEHVKITKSLPRLHTRIYLGKFDANEAFFVEFCW